MKTEKIISARIIIVVLVFASLFSCAREKNNSKVSDNSGMKVLTAGELVKDMGVGWNLGNTLEAIGGETKWGNPLGQRLIDSVKAAGFNR